MFQEVVTALGDLVKVMTSKQNLPDFRDMASFLPPTRFSGRVAADAAAHWESFQRFLEVMHTQGKITQGQQAAKLQEILSYFQSTLKSPAVDWFKHVRPTIKSVDELHHAFRRKYNHYGKTSDEQEEYWARMSWDPEETDFNAFREEVETLGKILDKTTQNIFYKLQKAMPQAFRAVIADCTNADELEDKITRLTKLSVHLHQKTSTPANQSKTALQDLLFHTLAGASAEAPAPAPNYPQPMAYQQQAPPPYHVQYYTPPQPVPENVDYFGPGGHPMGTMRASKFLPTHPDNQSFSSQAAPSQNRQSALPPLSQPPPPLPQGTVPQHPMMFPPELLQQMYEFFSKRQRQQAQDRQQQEQRGRNDSSGFQQNNYYNPNQNRNRNQGNQGRNQGQRNQQGQNRGGRPNNNRNQNRQDNYKPFGNQLQMCQACLIGEHDPTSCAQTSLMYHSVNALMTSAPSQESENDS